MKCDVINKSALKIVGLKINVGPFDKRIQELWDTFMSRFTEVTNTANQEVAFGICCYPDAGVKTFDYIAGVLVTDDKNIPEGMVYYEIPERKYAVFTHKGSVANLPDTYKNIYDKWLTENGLEEALYEEIEWYDKRFKFGEPDSEMDIFVPVK
mgnify:CR=1 FL=1